jgi:predicted kinase
MPISKLLVITGTMGAGKSTAMAEASDLLTAAGIVHAAIDVDALAVGHLPYESARDIAYENLRLLSDNFVRAGVDTLIAASAIESREHLTRLCEAVVARGVVVCRLRASLPTLQARVRMREPGLLQQQFVDRVATLDAILDLAAVENFTLANDGRSITDIAREMLERAGWLRAAARGM